MMLISEKILTMLIKAMKHKMQFILTVVLAVIAGVAYSQCKGPNWPEDKAKAEEQVALYGDAMRSGNYRGATAGLQWMLTNAPKWQTKLYIDGAEIYDKLAEKEADPAKKQALVDSLMWIFDERIKNCGEEQNVMNRKVYANYRYNIKNKEKLKGLLDMFDKVYDMSGTNVTDVNLVAFMTTVQANTITLKNLTEDEIFSRYDKIMSAIEAKLKVAHEKQNQKDIDKLKGYKDVVDGQLIKIVKVNCEFVKAKLAPKFRANPDDHALARKIFGFMLADKCTDDPLWLEAGESIIKSGEKDFGLVKNIALKHLANGKYDRAEELFKLASTEADKPEDKSEVLVYLGQIEAKKGNKAVARDVYRQALAANPNNKEAYEKIGDLYYTSFDECAKKVSMAEDRLVYIAAYDMYARSGDAHKMAQAKAQFPSTAEIFELSWKEGDAKRIGCWIQEGVTLRTRGKE